MKKNLERFLRILTLAILLCALGIVALYISAAVDQAAIEKDPACESLDAAAACYSLDTSRPEWLTGYVYLPLIIRNY